jgi:S-adenosylmethionine decarboxylase proenzyme
MLPLAHHTLVEFHGCDSALLRKASALRPLVLAAVRAGHGTIVTDIFHDFSPHGASGVVVIAESHVAIHTWPEHGFAAVDIFACSASLDPQAIVASLQIAFCAEEVSSQTIDRGNPRPSA